MKTILRISILFFLLFASCKKSEDQQYTLKFYGDAYEDIGYSVAIAIDGYVITGQVTDIIRKDKNIDNVLSNKNMAIIKTGWDGNIIWKKSFGGKFSDIGSKIYQNTDGSLICSGTFTDTTTITPGETNIFVVKVSATGSIEWQKTYGGAGNQTGKDVVKLSDGYMILGTTDIERLPVTASTGNTGGNTDIFLLKIKENGDSVESFSYGFPGNDLGLIIKPDQAGKFIVFGTTEQSDPGQEKHNLLLVRINPVGYTTQAIIIGGTEDEYAGDMEALTDGYLLTYNILKNDGTQRAVVKKLKNDIYAPPYFTNKIPIYNSSTSDSSAAVYALSKYKSDSYILAGQSGKSTAAKMLIFEMDANGNLVEGNQMIKGSTGTQVAYDVVSGDDEFIIAVGKNFYDVNSMMTFLKFKY